jgi:hypothetical protein
MRSPYRTGIDFPARVLPKRCVKHAVYERTGFRPEGDGKDPVAHPCTLGGHMGIGASLILIAAGAILRWAVNADTDAVNLDVVGLVLLIVGAAGLVLSLVFWSSWGGYGPWRRGVVVEDDPYDERRRRVV